MQSAMQRTAKSFAKYDIDPNVKKTAYNNNRELTAASKKYQTTHIIGNVKNEDTDFVSLYLYTHHRTKLIKSY